MHTGKRFTPLEFFRWTRCDTYWMLAIAAIPTALYALGWKFLALPWQPIAILGTAMAFIVGFKNNASYNRIWEARQIYGAIINNSRSFGYTLRDALGGRQSEIARRMIYRHIALLTALRYQLRDPRTWETIDEYSNAEFREAHYKIPERDGKLEETLGEFLPEDELNYILSNLKLQILHLPLREGWQRHPFANAKRAAFGVRERYSEQPDGDLSV